VAVQPERRIVLGIHQMEAFVYIAVQGNPCLQVRGHHSRQVVRQEVEGIPEGLLKAGDICQRVTFNFMRGVKSIVRGLIRKEKV
jgi:hypothetical protein